MGHDGSLLGNCSLCIWCSLNFKIHVALELFICYINSAQCRTLYFWHQDMIIGQYLCSLEKATLSLLSNDPFHSREFELTSYQGSF